VLATGSLDTLLWLTIGALAAIVIDGLLEQARRVILLASAPPLTYAEQFLAWLGRTDPASSRAVFAAALLVLGGVLFLIIRAVRARCEMRRVRADLARTTRSARWLGYLRGGLSHLPGFTFSRLREKVPEGRMRGVFWRMRLRIIQSKAQ
jgi:hypothetical protein